eukprot:4427642-Ditylum_brightwellii.AAC.1
MSDDINETPIQKKVTEAQHTDKSKDNFNLMERNLNIDFLFFMFFLYYMLYPRDPIERTVSRISPMKN